MKEVYTAQDLAEAEAVRDLLIAKGFRAIVRGEYHLLVDLPVGRAFPSVFVKDDADWFRARGVVEEFLAERESVHAAPSWRCANCGEEHASQFDECWNCGAARQQG